MSVGVEFPATRWRFWLRAYSFLGFALALVAGLGSVESAIAPWVVLWFSTAVAVRLTASGRPPVTPTGERESTPAGTSQEGRVVG